MVFFNFVRQKKISAFSTIFPCKWIFFWLFQFYEQKHLRVFEWFYHKDEFTTLINTRIIISIFFIYYFGHNV